MIIFLQVMLVLIGVVTVCALFLGALYSFDEDRVGLAVTSAVGCLLLTSFLITLLVIATSEDNSGHCKEGTRYVEWVEGYGKHRHTEWGCEAVK